MTSTRPQSPLHLMNELAWDTATAVMDAAADATCQTVRLWQIWVDAFSSAQEKQRAGHADLEQRLVQEMTRTASDTFARSDDFIHSDRTGEARVATSVLEATGVEEIVRARDANVCGEEDRTESRVAEARRPVAARASRSVPRQGFPHCAGRDALIHAIMTAAKTDAEQATRAVDIILGAITNALAQGEDVRLPRFGSFTVIETQRRLGRHPRTREPLIIPAGRRPVFRPGSALRKAVVSTGSP